MRQSVVVSATALAMAALVTMAPAVGAQGASEKVEKKIEQAEDKAKSASEKAKTELSDSKLTAKTKIALFADDRVKGRQVSVDTIQGVVHLRGKVDSQEAKAAAGEIAKGMEGAKSVKNDLQIVAPAQRKAVEVNDKDITRQVEQRLAKNSQTKKIEVRTDAGVVTLTGEVPSIAASAKASEMAKQVTGVRAVKNQLTYAEAKKG